MKSLDVVVVGAGLSGIDAGYHLKDKLPDKRFTILESRDRLGGTWDLFRYPGIRSDSDMFTLGFPFYPWKNPKAIADGPDILAYLDDTAQRFGIDRHIELNHKVVGARWSTPRASWELDVAGPTGTEQIQTNFLYLCSGYYDYDGGYTPELPGSAEFTGRIIHPQKWTDDIDVAGKKVIVIGSGATAVTLVPALAKRGAQVTMLQRSPTYIMSRPAKDPIADWLTQRLPADTAAGIARWKNVLMGMGFFAYSRKWPARAKEFLLQEVRKIVRDDAAVAEHFTPSYNPWDQRLCLVPDSDLFEAIRSGQATVVTDHIARFDRTGIALESGKHLDADIVVTATGLRLRALGGIPLVVDGTPVELSKTMMYKGMMLSDVPNLAFAVGYTNASWTLKCDLTSQYVTRLLGYMHKKKRRIVIPRRTDPTIGEEPAINFNSGYVLRDIGRFPKQGSATPWKLYQNYALDLLTLRYGRLADKSLELS